MEFEAEIHPIPPGRESDMADGHDQAEVQSVGPDTGTYAGAVKPRYPAVNTTKPVFFSERDVFGTTRLPKDQWILHPEMYRVVGAVVDIMYVTGLHRVNGLWRIYTDNQTARTTLLTNGIHIRGKTVSLSSLNPNRLDTQTPNTIHIRIKDVPLSADDGQIDRALNLRECEIVGKVSCEKLRIDGRLTNCDTGDRIAVVKTPLSQDIPRVIEIGRYRAKIFYPGQTPPTRYGQTLECRKCLEEGHYSRDCVNDWRCRQCKCFGHKEADCPCDLLVNEDNVGLSPPSGAPHLQEDTTETTDVYKADTETESESDENTAHSRQPRERQKTNRTPADQRRRRVNPNQVDRAADRTPPTPAEDLNSVVKRHKADVDMSEPGESPTAQSTSKSYHTDSDEYW
jgi:hypothetical protein